jgi:hypothetical protein
MLGSLRAQANQSRERSDEKIVFKGRVLAYVDSMTVGAGIGPLYETFIFGIESKGERGAQVITPIEVLYAFPNWNERLPHNFLDHGRLYELHMTRETMCDEKLSVLSYEKNKDENGKKLPPTNILRLMDGAPKDLLKAADSMLPCYRLTPGNYQELK